jgi:hypothetical protein
LYSAVRFNSCVLTPCANCAKNIGKRAKKNLEKNKINVICRKLLSIASVVLKIGLAVRFALLIIAVTLSYLFVIYDRLPSLLYTVALDV